MVYHPSGGFRVGSGGQNSGELRNAPDVSTTGTASTFTITGTSPTLQGNSNTSSASNLAARNNAGIDLTGTNTATLSSEFPTGFNAFYSMKYEISQQQYVDFLNTLTYSQQVSRTATSPNSSSGTGALNSTNNFRNGIDIQTSGTESSIPALYACNFNGNSTYNEADDGQTIACNFLSWDDVAAFLDWAALRPMTELEFEKAARGSANPVINEFAWGSSSAIAATGISNAGLINELASTSSNIVYNNILSSGPIRTGMFATNGSSRTNSGAGYYGAMELSGNLWERCVTVGNSSGRSFSPSNGDGSISNSGAANVNGWSSLSGIGYKGGSWQTNVGNAAAISDRVYAAYADNVRYEDGGGRGARSDLNTIVGNGLQVWFDAGVPASYSGNGTTWTDLSGNNYHGTLVNGTGYNSANGGSLQFDGINDYVTLTKPSALVNGGTITICLFAKWITTGTSVSTIKILVDNNHTGTQGFVIQDRPDLSKILSWGGLNSSYQVGNGNWVFIAVTQSTTNSYMYINGSLHAQTTISGGLVNLQPNLYIGAWGAGGRYLNGNIGNVLIYNRALSATEISQNFNALKSRFGL
ncbi:MAG: hypothetical protein FGM61_05590 [Sediminibacterium sp.]|nr:hypothetical protein [Sediminibacterium sp.]